MYVRRDAQHWLRPLAISWGWEAVTPSDSAFIDHHEWQGTRDLSAFLATPAAIEWMASCDWAAVQQECHRLVDQARRRVDALTGLASVYPDDSFQWFGQMVVVRLPDVDVTLLKQRLYDEFRVETPVHRFADQPLLRISIAAYNIADDVDALVDALTTLLPQFAG